LSLRLTSGSRRTEERVLSPEVDDTLTVSQRHYYVQPAVGHVR
jgi:hypothetical protein